METQKVKPLKIRDKATKSVFIFTCWSWLQDMKILEPHKIRDDLTFSQWSKPHSLTRRLGIALQCMEIQNDDAANKLPDRFRAYWKKNRAFYGQIFGPEKLILQLPSAPYEFPSFQLNVPYPETQMNINAHESSISSRKNSVINFKCVDIA